MSEVEESKKDNINLNEAYNGKSLSNEMLSIYVSESRERDSVSFMLWDGYSNPTTKVVVPRSEANLFKDELKTALRKVFYKY